jgi:hypothetical protein
MPRHQKTLQYEYWIENKEHKIDWNQIVYNNDDDVMAIMALRTNYLS